MRVGVDVENQVRVRAHRQAEMGRKVRHLPQQPGLQEHQVPGVVDTGVGVAAERGHEGSGWTRQAVVRTCHRIDDTAIEREQEQVFEPGRQVPARLGFVEDAVTGDGAVVLEPFGQKADRGDVLVLDAAAVVPEVAERFEDGPVGFALAVQEKPRRQPVGQRRPCGRAAVGRQVHALAGSDITRVRVLMHVDDHVDPECSRPVHDLGGAIDVGLVEATALRLEQAPGERQAQRVEAKCRHLSQVRLAQRRVVVRDDVRTATPLVRRRVDRIDGWCVGPGAVAEVKQVGGHRAVEKHHPFLVVGDVRRVVGGMFDMQPGHDSRWTR